MTGVLFTIRYPDAEGAQVVRCPGQVPIFRLNYGVRTATGDANYIWNRVRWHLERGAWLAELNDRDAIIGLEEAERRMRT